MSGSALLMRAPESARTSATANRAETVEIAALATDCLRLQLETYPKPGLVSDIDSGSHSDMDGDMFHRSIDAIRPHLRALAQAGAEGFSLERLEEVSLEAEEAMRVATGNVNTHRGAIFGMGLLCAAAGARTSGLADAGTPLGSIVVQRWGRGSLNDLPLWRSQGQRESVRYGGGGARGGAVRGFPVVYEIGLPALREGSRLAPADFEAARVHACFALIAALDDTNLLHRGGLPGLLFAQRTAREFLDQGGVGRPGWRKHAVAAHKAFIARRLSPGGAADLLALSLFVWGYESGTH